MKLHLQLKTRLHSQKNQNKKKQFIGEFMVLSFQERVLLEILSDMETLAGMEAMVAQQDLELSVRSCVQVNA